MSTHGWSSHRDQMLEQDLLPLVRADTRLVVDREHTQRAGEFLRK